MDKLSLLTAFTAGILSFLSPCILPLLPGYLSFLTGYSLEENPSGIRKNALLGGLFFGAGFTVVFVLLGATATSLGKFLIQNKWIITTILGIVVIVFGLHLLGIFRLKFLYMEKKIHITPKKHLKRGNLQAFLLGLAFAFGWTPCITPILGGILTIAATQTHVSQGILLLILYSLGLWIPFMLAALFTVPVLGFLGKYPKIALRAQQFSGILLIIMGILLITGYMTRITSILG